MSAAAAATATDVKTSGSGGSGSHSALRNAKLDEAQFVSVLGQLMGEVEKYLMNKPPQYIPQESMAGRHVLAALKPYSTENG